MNKKVSIGLGIAGVVLFLGVLIYAIAVELKPEFSKKANKVPTIDPKELVAEGAEIDLHDYYKLDMSMYGEDGDNSRSMYVTLDQEKNTFSFWMGYQMMGSGSYTTENNEVVCTLSNDPEHPMSFIADGPYLMLESTICAGTVPAEETFEETFYQKSSDTDVYYYIFHKDGSYTLRQTHDDAESPKDISADGTYTVEGDKIHCTVGEFPCSPYLIYKNHLVANFYEQISEEQFYAEAEESRAAAEKAGK